MINREKMLTAAEVAEYLDVHLRTVHVWLREGKLRGAKAGHFWRIRPEDLDRFLFARREEE